MMKISLHREVEMAYQRWTEALTNSDRVELEIIHGESFVYTGLDGRRLAREAHIELELAAEVEPQVVEDLHVHACGPVVIATGEHQLRGDIPHAATSGYRPVFGDVASTVRFTTVWMRSELGLRVWAMHLDLSVSNRESPRPSASAEQGKHPLRRHHAVIEVATLPLSAAVAAADDPCVVTDPGGRWSEVDRLDGLAEPHVGGEDVVLHTEGRGEVVLAWGSGASASDVAKRFAFTQLWRVSPFGLFLSCSHASNVGNVSILSSEDER